MSIRFLKHNEIDREQWNELLLSTPNRRLFSHYDYLTAVHPDWQAMVEIEENTYKAAFPLPSKQIFGLKYLVQPRVVQQLQILKRQSILSAEFIDALHQKLKTYRSVRLSLDQASADVLRSLDRSQRQTMVLELESGRDYYTSFAKKHQQSIRISAKFDFRIEKDKDFHGVIEGFIQNKGTELGLGKDSEKALLRLIPFFESQDDCKVHSARDANGNLHAAGLFAGFGETMTFLLSFSDVVGKKNCLMHAIIHDWLENDSEKFKKLDFEGGNIKTLERFYSRFGAIPEYFSYVESLRFPFNLYFRNGVK